MTTQQQRIANAVTPKIDSITVRLMGQKHTLHRIVCAKAGVVAVFETLQQAQAAL